MVGMVGMAGETSGWREVIRLGGSLGSSSGLWRVGLGGGFGMPASGVEGFLSCLVGCVPWRFEGPAVSPGTFRCLAVGGALGAGRAPDILIGGCLGILAFGLPFLTCYVSETMEQK